MKRFAVYTVVTGGYDDVKQPLVIDERFDYILFSNDFREDKIGIWHVYKLNEKRLGDISSKRKLFLLSRLPKICSCQTLDEYEATLYIDGTLQISSQYVYDRCVELFQNDIEWGYIKHQHNKDIYAEMRSILNLQWVHDYEIFNWYQFLLQEKFPRGDILYENGVIFRKKTITVQKIEELWWWCVLNYTSRDQFSLMYAIWKNSDLKSDLLMTETEDVWHNNGHFIYTNHASKRKLVKKTTMELVRHRCWRIAHPDMPYDNILDYATQKRDILLYIHMWTIYALFRYGYRVLLEMITIRLKAKD